MDADLADYFGSIPHTELMRSLARHVVDRRVLHLIKVWLECPVEETDDRGRKKHTALSGCVRKNVMRSCAPRSMLRTFNSDPGVAAPNAKAKPRLSQKKSKSQNQLSRTGLRPNAKELQDHIAKIAT